MGLSRLPINIKKYFTECNFRYIFRHWMNCSNINILSTIRTIHPVLEQYHAKDDADFQRGCVHEDAGVMYITNNSKSRQDKT